MGFDVIVSGDVSLPGKGIAPWRRVKPDPMEFDDWDGAVNPTTAIKFASTAKLLAELLAWKGRAQGYAFVELSFSLGRAVVRAFLPEDDFAEWGAPIVAALRAAGPLGGEGRVTICDAGGAPHWYEVKIADGTSTVASKRGRMVPKDLALIKQIEKRAEELFKERTKAAPVAVPSAEIVAMVAAKSALKVQPPREPASKDFDKVRKWLDSKDRKDLDRAGHRLFDVGQEARDARLYGSAKNPPKPLDARWRALAKKLLAHSHPQVVNGAVFLLHHLDEPTLGDTLLALCDDRRIGVKQHALTMLINRKDARARPILERKLAAEKDPNQKRNIKWDIEALEHDFEGGDGG